MGLDRSLHIRHFSLVRAVKELARLRGCEGSPED